MLPRQTLSSAAAAAIRDQILGGEYPAGAPLRQQALASALGVSRIPLREALRQLEAEGLVTLLPHRGAIVTPIPVAEARELFELRAILETDLLRRAVPQMTRADDGAVAHQVQAFEDAVAAGDVTAWGEANRRLHLALYAASARPVTLDTVTRLHAQSDRFLRLQLTLGDGTMTAIREHREIADAARRRDATESIRLLRHHILGAGRALGAALDRQHGRIA